MPCQGYANMVQEDRGSFSTNHFYEYCGRGEVEGIYVTLHTARPGLWRKRPLTLFLVVNRRRSNHDDLEWKICRATRDWLVLCKFDEKYHVEGGGTNNVTHTHVEERHTNRTNSAAVLVEGNAFIMNLDRWSLMGFGLVGSILRLGNHYRTDHLSDGLVWQNKCLPFARGFPK